jgi:hypothetical protein
MYKLQSTFDRHCLQLFQLMTSTKFSGVFAARLLLAFRLAAANKFYIAGISQICELLTITVYAAGQFFTPADFRVNLC